MNDQPSPIPAPLPDAVYPFQIEDRAIRGRLVRLSRVSDAILHAHSYPERVANLLAENLALAAALASGLKYDGIFTLQVQGDGPLGLLVADITSEGVMRGYARFDETRLADVPTDATPLSLFGKGYIAFTVDQGPDTERYQGITEVVGETLADCANAYFRQSEQLATAIQLATDGRSAAALMLQRLPAAGGGEIAQDVAEDDWQTAVILAGTATPLEMLDLSLAPNDLLFRLFHEGGVRAFDPRSLSKGCRCSEAKILNLLATFPEEDLADMVEDGLIRVTCEFCNETYGFEPGAVVERQSSN